MIQLMSWLRSIEQRDIGIEWHDRPPVATTISTLVRLMLKLFVDRRIVARYVSLMLGVPVVRLWIICEVRRIVIWRRPDVVQEARS